MSLLLLFLLDKSPLRINHVGDCIRTKSPFSDWSSDNYKVQNKKSALAVIMEDPELIKGGFTHPE